jgi:hypothetical protein
VTADNTEDPKAPAAPTATAVDAFKGSIETWAEAQLSRYLERLEKQQRELGDRPLGLEAKEINDAVWGTIVFKPLELMLLDSPLLQRLRGIRQLGVVHLVYPSGVHTRFEHSIGAVHQVSRVIRSINEHSGAPHAIIVGSLEDLLRVTALCHDVATGSCPMSQKMR